MCNAIIARIEKNSSLTVDELMQYMKGPDFPLENVIINSKDIREAYRTGRSAVSLKVRGKYRIEKDEIIFDTIPYRTYRNKIKEQITKNADELEQCIDDFADESNVGINKLVFKVKRGINPEEAVLKLFALTDLQTTLSYNMNFIVNGTPKMCSMMDLVDAYVAHQIKVLLKSTEFDKEKAEARKHILEGLLLILSNIDKAIQLIRESENKEEAANKLIKYFSLDKVQAQAVLNMKLSSLTKLDKNDLIKELEEKKLIIAECNKIINEEIYRNQVLIKKIQKLKDKYGDNRRTELLNIEIPKKQKESIQIIPEDVIITLTDTGNIKKIPINNFKVQKTNRKGIKTANETVISTVSTTTIDSLLIFTQKGKMFKLTVENIPSDLKGANINTLIKFDENDKPIAITPLNNDTSKYVVFFTKKGLIKKTLFEEYTKTKRSTGLVAIKLNENDSIANVEFISEENVLIITKNGFSIYFNSKEVNPLGRAAAGVKSIKLDNNDEVVIGIPIKTQNDLIAVITSKGYGKRVSIKDFSIQTRGGKGIIIYKTDENYGKVAGACLITNGDKLILSGQPNSICVAAADLPLISRIGYGNIIIKSKINSIAKI